MKNFIFLLVLISFPIVVFASSPGGSDTCGLGWEITQRKSFLATSTRITTNVFVPPTFGMTTGTIGCDQHSLVKKDIPAAVFVASNFDNLKQEMAAGQGEVLEGLARSMGCSDASIAGFGQMTQQNYKAIVNDNAITTFKNIKGKVQSDAKLAKACSV